MSESTKEILAEIEGAALEVVSLAHDDELSERVLDMLRKSDVVCDRLRAKIAESGE